MLIHNKDDIEFVNEFPCFLEHPDILYGLRIIYQQIGIPELIKKLIFCEKKLVKFENIKNVGSFFKTQNFAKKLTKLQFVLLYFQIINNQLNM